MRKIKLSEIDQINQSLKTFIKDKQISLFVRSQPNYSPGRKRPKDPNEAKILESFKRK